ncbi:UNVERIFIED_CONTAM: hypothetical protein Sradi_2005600 [Sesamum radiatum]|uniref:Uncharacterized protein n=1 Tax=Sesamum radiatum TaxID=300843 RepID=A0AAW2TFF9_SESRA
MLLHFVAGKGFESDQIADGGGFTVGIRVLISIFRNRSVIWACGLPKEELDGDLVKLETSVGSWCMDRCSVAGYERQHRPEDLDLLKEAKRKEKKHKKDKKDKERKKDKEKKEKDGSDEKHRDKKDRKGKRKDKKEKHRDKKDKEDRGKEKEKSSISEESTVAGELEAKSGGKLHQKGQSKDRSSSLDEGKCSALFSWSKWCEAFAKQPALSWK